MGGKTKGSQVLGLGCPRFKFAADGFRASKSPIASLDVQDSQKGWQKESQYPPNRLYSSNTSMGD
jgi:hypothetical protein